MNGGVVLLKVSVSDEVSGEAKAGEGEIEIWVEAVNDAPEVQADSVKLVTQEDTVLPLSGITLLDVDAGENSDGHLSLTLTTANGAIITGTSMSTIPGVQVRVCEELKTRAGCEERSDDAA